MSGGEKARLGLAMLVWGRPGFLVLDEPTNHLDATTRDALADALADFEGPLLLVSHDRYLLRATVDEFFLVDQGVLRPFDGDLDDYAQWLQQDRRDTAQAGTARAGAGDRSANGSEGAGGEAAPGMDTGASRVDARRDRARARAAANALRQPLEKRVRKIEDELARNQARAAEIDRSLAAPDAYADREAATDLGRERARLGSDIRRLEDEWLQLHADLESMDLADPG